MPDFSQDERIVLTLDAGGTNFDFSAIRGSEAITPQLRLSSNGDDLNKCIQNIKDGFAQLLNLVNGKPVAISFAFPGPADYKQGIIGDLNNLPAFRGGVPLKAILEKEFQLPVFINNDGDLFTYGEALYGILPKVNRMLSEAGNPKRYKNLVGLTLGTGFGGGIVSNGILLAGDNSMAAEVNLISMGISSKLRSEDLISTHAIRKEYARIAGISITDTPEPKNIASIARGESKGHQEAARMTFHQMGIYLGDAMANLMTIVDGLVVIGGGMIHAHDLIFPAVQEQLNGYFDDGEKRIPRLVQKVYNLEDEMQVKEFLKTNLQQVRWEGLQELSYDPNPALAFGVSTLGTGKATAIGAYAYALSKL